MVATNIRRGASLAVAVALALATACSSSGTSSPPPSTPADAGGGDAGTTEVPKERLAADPASACPGKYKTTPPVAGQNVELEVAGQKRAFFAIFPEGGGDEPAPLFVAFNGTGETGQSFATRAKLSEMAQKGFVVIAPSSAGNGATWPVWDSLRQPGTEAAPNKDLELFDTLVQCVAAHRPIDKNRIYVGGHSAGGIMTNHVLQRRSKLLAGGIVASGVYSLTSPSPREALDPMFVLVTWGGDNDKYSGSAGGVSVGGFNFANEASLASQAYAKDENVGEANCRGQELGHAWLPMTSWMADLLLQHPKGRPGKGKGVVGDLPPVPAGVKVTCSDDPYQYTSGIDVQCLPGAKDGCREACQLMGDCAVENGTVGPALKPQLTELGFSGANNESCGGCVARCDQKATTPDDPGVLQCFKDRQAAAKCGNDIAGAFPLINAVNDCCKDKQGSGYCTDVCTIIKKSSSAASFFSTCNSF
ncbi:MAG: alpha/beta fold hydrolase [Myxococcales bacterium]|jgi:poly(3-hydroxybutyrate) depolymerase|nr:alpha/beta fold hydrolase [Myxococcales bacterium]